MMSSSPVTGPGAGPAGVELPPADAGSIDRGLRWPLLALWGGAVTWLVLGSLLGVFASMKMHAPGVLADWAWLTYGRVRPATTAMLVYGFAGPAAVGLSLWLLARLGRTGLAGAIPVMLAAKTWHFGVLVGVMGILAGEATGFERFEMPGYAQAIVLLAGLVFGVCGLLTFQARRVRELYPTQWYLLAALVWLPWVLSTAWLLLVVWPVRGAVQMAVQTWCANGLSHLWLGPVGVGALLYFVPMLAGRPLHSRYLAMFAFWTYVLFAGWTGVHSGAPLPAWMVGMSVVCGVLLLVPVWATALNLGRTLGPSLPKAPGVASRNFLLFGAAWFVLSGLLFVFQSVPEVDRLMRFSLFGPGLDQAFLLGFFGSVALAAIYQVGPLVAGAAWPAEAWARVHFWLHAVGVCLVAVPLLLGGLVHGSAWNDPNLSAIEVSKKTLPFIGSATTGHLVLLAGAVLLGANVVRLVGGRVRAVVQPWWASCLAPEKPAGARA